MSAESKKRFLAVGRERNISWRTDNCEDDEIRERFWDIKEELRRQEPFEVTNEYVMSILLDLYWIHHENGGQHDR